MVSSLTHKDLSFIQSNELVAQFDQNKEYKWQQIRVSKNK